MIPQRDSEKKTHRMDKIFTNNIFDREFSSSVNKELLQMNSKKTNNSIKNGKVI